MITYLVDALMARIDKNKTFLQAVEILFVFIFVRGIVEIRYELSFFWLFVYAFLAIILVWGFFRNLKNGMAAVIFGLIGGGFIFGVSAGIFKPLFNMFFTYYQIIIQNKFPFPNDLNIFFIQIAINLKIFFDSLNYWWTGLQAGQLVRLEQPSMFVWGVTIFFCVSWFVWQIHRAKKPYLAGIPVLIIFTVLQDYANGKIVFLAVLLAANFFVVAVFNHMIWEEKWEQGGTGYSQELRLDIRWAAGALALAIFLTALFIPSISAKEIIERIDEINEEKSVRVVTPGPGEVSSGESSASEGSLAGPSGILPTSHLLDTPPELLDIELFQVRAIDETQAEVLASSYWRLKALDIYTGHGWVTGPIDVQSYQQNQKLPLGMTTYGEPLGLEIAIQSNQTAGLLVYSGQLISVGEPVQVSYHQGQTIIEELVFGEVNADRYTLQTIPESLQQGASFPIDPAYEEWVYENYLNLPDEIPRRVDQLARVIVREQTDPYLMALNIESYLRGIPYSLDVGLPPDYRDVVDYFLFDLKRGYCDYYASAMVVLSRIVGLPARLVVGYAPGDFDADSHTVQITGLEGHAWVEVYISGRGWVTFEPTGGRPPLEHEHKEDSGEIEAAESNDFPKFNILTRLITHRYFLVGMIAIGLLPFLFMLAERLWLASLSSDEMVVGMKHDFYLLAERLSIQHLRQKTLLEIQGEAHELLSEWAEKPSRRWVVKMVRRVVPPQVKTFSEVAYHGELPERLDRSSLMRDFLQLKYSVRLVRLATLFWKK